MKNNSHKTARKSNQDRVCRSFLMDYTGIPGALFGGQMEKEAYLDSLFPRFKGSELPPKMGTISGASR